MDRYKQAELLMRISQEVLYAKKHILSTITNFDFCLETKVILTDELTKIFNDIDKNIITKISNI